MSKVTNLSVNLGVAFTDLVNSSFILYSGCLIEKTKGKFMVHDRLFNTVEEAKAEIDGGIKAIANSIKRANS